MRFRPNRTTGLLWSKDDTPTSTTTRLLRFDPMFGLAIGKLESACSLCAASRQKHSESVGDGYLLDRGAGALCKSDSGLEVLEQVFQTCFLCFMTAHHVSS